ncbi:MAG: hypothetical protein RJB13_643 [Pseudomonadota bacterium]
MHMAQEEPSRLKSEMERAMLAVSARSQSLAAQVDAAAQMALSWKEYSMEREKVEEQLNLARYEYKTVLKRTEVAALSGQPRLYWFAKAMFAKLRKHSLEYQVFEAKVKLDALESSYQRLLSLQKSLQLDVRQMGNILTDEATAETRSTEHSQLMAEVWQQHQAESLELERWQRKAVELDVANANSGAAIAGVTNSKNRSCSQRSPVVVQSEKMLTSKLAHVGFINKTKLLGLVEQSEFAAEHAEKDLQKVREGLRTAADAAVDGKATRMSREWVDYCKSIVCRYFEHDSNASTPR